MFFAEFLLKIIISYEKIYSLIICAGQFLIGIGFTNFQSLFLNDSLLVNICWCNYGSKGKHSGIPTLFLFQENNILYVKVAEYFRFNIRFQDKIPPNKSNHKNPPDKIPPPDIIPLKITPNKTPRQGILSGYPIFLFV